MAHALFDKIPGRKKRLMFWEGDHDDWPAEMISKSITSSTSTPPDDSLGHSAAAFDVDIILGGA
jgi:hypothetical protein